MAQPPRVIHCRLQDCFYYKNYPENAAEPSPHELCFCHHPNNDLLIEYEACKFYRMDWTKKLKTIKKPTPNQDTK